MHPVQDMNVQPPNVTPPSGGPDSDEDQHCAKVAPERLPAAGGQTQVLLPSRKGSSRFFQGGVIAAGALVVALLVTGLAASVQSRFFRNQDGEVCCGSGSEDDEKTDDSTANSGRVLSFAEMRRLAAKAIRVQEPLRRQRLRTCAAPYPDEVKLLVEEAYEAAKRHAERRAIEWNPCRGGTQSGLSIIEVQEKQCEDVVAFIERVCSRQLEAPLSTHDAEQNTSKEDAYRDYPGREPETAHCCLVNLMTRLLPDMPYEEVKRSVNEVLSPACMTDQIDYDDFDRDIFPSRYLIKDEYPFRTVQCWAAPAHAQSIIEEQKREIRRLELRARMGERQSHEQILDLLVFNPRSFFTADPVLANEIYESAKMANPNLRLRQEPQIQLVLFLSANTPSGWGDHRAYPEEEGVNLDLWGDGEPGYLFSLAWHYAHDPAFRWDIFQRILSDPAAGPIVYWRTCDGPIFTRRKTTAWGEMGIWAFSAMIWTSTSNRRGRCAVGLPIMSVSVWKGVNTLNSMNKACASSRCKSPTKMSYPTRTVPGIAPTKKTRCGRIWPLTWLVFGKRCCRRSPPMRTRLGKSTGDYAMN